MKVVVDKKALLGFIDQIVNEDRSFHTKNVNELEKSQPQIFPQEQMAQQLSQTKLPVEDSEFEPTNRSELGKAAMQLSDTVLDEKIAAFYASLKKLAKQNSGDPGDIKIKEARHLIDRAVFQIMSEARKPYADAINRAIASLPKADLSNIDDESEIDDSTYERLMDKGLATDPMERALDRITNIIDKLPRDQRKSVFFTQTSQKAFDDPLAPYIYEPKEDMQEIADDLMNSLAVKRIMSDEGINSSVRVEQMRKKLFNYFESNRPKITPELGPVVLDVAAAKLVDMIWNDHRDDIDGFIKMSKELIQDLKARMGKTIEIWPAPDKEASPYMVNINLDFINIVRKQFVKYLRKFGKSEKDVVALSDIDIIPDPAQVKKEKLPSSPREITTYSEVLDVLVQLRNNEPATFMKLINSLAPIDVNGQKIIFGSMTIEDFDDLDDATKTQVLYQASKDKDLSGKAYRWLQNFERTVGMKMYKDKDYLPSYYVNETTPGEFTMQALPWKAFPDDLVEMFYDNCVKSVINSALIRGFNLDFPTFMSSFASNEKLDLRKAIKGILYTLLLTNRSEFEDELEIWYELHDTKNKIATLKKYETEIEILNSSGFVVESTEMDQYFTNLSSASLDIYHLANGILYAIALKHVHELIVKGKVRTGQSNPADNAEKFQSLLALVKSAYETDFQTFVALAQNQIPMKLKISYTDYLATPWNSFYAKNKAKIDDGINKKITQSSSVKGAVDPSALNFFEDFINLTKSEDKYVDEDDKEDISLGTTVGDDIESVKEKLADLLNTVLGGARKGGATTYSSVPAGIGMMIIKALKAYEPNALADKKQAVTAALNTLTSKDKIKIAGGITVNDPKGIMIAKQITENLMETILTKIFSSKTQQRRR